MEKQNAEQGLMPIVGNESAESGYEGENRHFVQAFLDGFAREVGKPTPAITPAALRALTAHSWPGNIRELEHEVRRLVYLCPDGQVIDRGMLYEHILDPPGMEASAPPSSLTLEAHVDHLERRLIRTALARTGGRRAAAARLLEISRNGLSKRHILRSVSV